MRVGVVCEGRTDFHAIAGFFASALKLSGVQANFEAIQPTMDNTQPDGGWGNVLLWLSKNPPATRIQNYFGGGLFEGSLGKEPFDCILLHLDSDILGENSFRAYVHGTYAYDVLDPSAPDDRANQIRLVIAIAAKFEEMTENDVGKHVIAPAVESTEAWCVAAANMPVENTEGLVGQQLTDAFMSALERSESRDPQPPYAKIDKSVGRRERFCGIYSVNSDRVVNGCTQFSVTLDHLNSLAGGI